MEFRDQAAKETSALIARLFAESAENSRQRLSAFRTAINNATKALEAAIGSSPNFEREVTDLVTRLAKGASAEAEAAAARTAAEARVAADAIRAELKAETKQKDALAASLKEARAKAESLQTELDAEKQRAETARREVSDARDALKQVEAARVEAVAERDKEAKGRATLETELHRLHEAADALRAEASSTSDQLEVAIAEKARLEEALAAAQSDFEAAKTKLASVTALYQQTAAKLKAAEKDHEAAVQALEANHGVVLRELEATHAAALRDMEASRHAAIDAALQEAERNHEAAIRDLQAVHAAAISELEAKHDVQIHQLEADHAAAERDSESRHGAALRDLEAQLQASSVDHSAHESVVSRVDELLDGFQALSGASSVGDVLATMVEHLAAQFSRVALFYVRGNRLEGSNQIGFEFDHDIAKLVFPLGMDSLLTRAVVSGRIEHVTGDELADSGLAPFGGAPTCALAMPVHAKHSLFWDAMPVVVQGETIAIVYADDSGRSAGELSTRFASALLQHAVALLMRLSNQLRHLSELREYATSLLTELQETYDSDVASGKNGEDLLHRLQNNLDFARSIYATRIEGEGPDAQPIFDEQLGGFMDEHAETRFGRDLLAIAGRGEVSRKAEAS